jgi:hypothetical protein
MILEQLFSHLDIARQHSEEAVAMVLRRFGMSRSKLPKPRATMESFNFGRRTEFATEKSQRKITQQQIANLLGTSRAVINRQLLGLENIGIKRVAEILWAIGWEPHFDARPIIKGANESPRPQVQLLREHNDQTASALTDFRKGFQQNNQSTGQSARSLAQENAYFDQRSGH